MLDKELRAALIQRGRDFAAGNRDLQKYGEIEESDQERKLPQPPLVKAAMRGEEARIALPKNFADGVIKADLLAAIRDRKSSRVYTQEEMSLVQLSFLLWATQGVKDLRGRSYATLRTVPSGGARHPFETYLVVRKVTGLAAGAYHYLPMEHELEFLGPVEDLEGTVSQSLCEQTFGAKANVIFYWSMVPYRAEWRYGIYAHRTALIDAGHVGQNLYLACAGTGLGCCGIAAFDGELCARLFGLDGKEEFIAYTATVGTIREKDRAEEQAFYSFVEEEGL